jgi:hypothetical protein
MRAGLASLHRHPIARLFDVDVSVHVESGYATPPEAKRACGVDDDLATTQFLEDDVARLVEVSLDREALQVYRPVFMDGPHVDIAVERHSGGPPGVGEFLAKDKVRGAIAEATRMNVGLDRELVVRKRGVNRVRFNAGGDVIRVRDKGVGTCHHVGDSLTFDLRRQFVRMGGNGERSDRQKGDQEHRQTFHDWIIDSCLHLLCFLSASSPRVAPEGTKDDGLDFCLCLNSPSGLHRVMKE